MYTNPVDLLIVNGNPDSMSYVKIALSPASASVAYIDGAYKDGEKILTVDCMRESVYVCVSV